MAQFKGKNGKFYKDAELQIAYIKQNTYLLNNYSMKELDSLYKQYIGNYTHNYIYILKAKIEAYDTSDEVNSFLIGDTKYWLDKNTRVGLMHLANCSTDNLQLVLDGNILTIPVDVAKNFLTQLEVYAGKCYLQTQKHLLAIKELKSIEDIINYDYTSGYPEKIQLNLDLI